MMNQTAVADSCQPVFPPSIEVVELVLLLPSSQFSALEVAAGRLNLTVGQLLRRTVCDFLPRPIQANTGMTATGVGEGS